MNLNMIPYEIFLLKVKMNKRFLLLIVIFLCLLMFIATSHVNFNLIPKQLN